MLSKAASATIRDCIKFGLAEGGAATVVAVGIYRVTGSKVMSRIGAVIALVTVYIAIIASERNQDRKPNYYKGAI